MNPTAIPHSDQLKHVIYDMLILAMSIRHLHENWPGEFQNSVFGPKEVAKSAALIKIRSLDCFLHSGGRQDDIVFHEFQKYATGPRGASIPHSFRESVNKYAAHLTKERTLQRIRRPKAGDVVKYGKQILESCKLFVEDCERAGLVAKGRSARYYRAFVDELSRIPADQCEANSQ